MVKLKSKQAVIGRKSGVRFYPFCKRCLDIFLSLFLLLAAAPLFFAVAFGIRVTSRGPVFFRQVRVGRRLEPFLLYKFRTMSCAAPRDVASAVLSSPDRYITPFGRFLRRSSLDEFPQLWNVLRGDMSLLGPRPLVLSEAELIFSRAARGVYTVRPGISGLAQISGRDFLDDREKLHLDAEYVRHLSFFSDFLLFFSTLAAVLARRGIKERA